MWKRDNVGRLRGLRVRRRCQAQAAVPACPAASAASRVHSRPSPRPAPRTHAGPPTSSRNHTLLLLLLLPPAQALVIDEVSMVSAEFFHLLESMCRQIRGLEAPFGGLQLILSGDFFQ